MAAAAGGLTISAMVVAPLLFAIPEVRVIGIMLECPLARGPGPAA